MMEDVIVRKAWTDYPILAFGDKSGEEAPVRKVAVLYYDDDKYLGVVVMDNDQGFLTEIKAGYIYAQKGRYGDVDTFDRHSVPLYHEFKKGLL